MKNLLFISCLLLPLILRSEPSPPSGTAERSEEDVREEMKMWSRQLGVTCVYCHDLENFKSASKEPYKVSLKHAQMVKVLQQEVFQDRDKGHKLKVIVECYMCHRSKEIPDFHEPPNNLTK